MRLFILTTLLTFSAFGAEIKEYKNCKLDSIDFTSRTEGEYVFDCQGSEKRFYRHRQVFEKELIEVFTNPRETFFSGDKVLQVSTGLIHAETITGISTPDKFKSLTEIKFNSQTRQITDMLGNELLFISEEELQNSKLVNVPAIKNEFHDKDRVIVQRSTDTRYMNTIVVVENCFPKSCGQTTYITLSKFVVE